MAPVAMNRGDCVIRRRRGEGNGGFTLLEICVVLFILAILAGVALPSIFSAFAEQGLRDDAREISLMVKTGMIQSNDQGRIYQIQLTPTTATLSPFVDPASDDPAAASSPAPATVDPDAKTDDQPTPDPAVNETHAISADNKIFLPDPDKSRGWIQLTDKTATQIQSSWLFKPGELCPFSRIRLERGKAWIELTFNALTGNVDNEKLDVP